MSYTCKFCGVVASPKDEENCVTLADAYRQTPMRPYGCPWFDKDSRKANPLPDPAADPLRDPQYIVEGIILRRLHEKRVEGYTLEMAKGIAAVLAAPQLIDRLSDVVMMLDAPDAYNREYIAAVCRSILSSVVSRPQYRAPGGGE